MSRDARITDNAGQPPLYPCPSNSEVTRRRFLTLLFGAASAVGLGAVVAPVVRFAYPVAKEQVFERVKVGTTGAVPPEGIAFEYQDTPAMLIMKQDKSYAAFSRVCTHLGCIAKWEGNKNRFHCPCHAGLFDENGMVTGGPPPKPLTKYKLVVEGNNIFVEGIERA